MQETFYRLNAPVRIALLTDLHERPFAPVQASLLHNKPEIICIAGDMIHGCLQAEGESKMESVCAVLKACAEIAPTFVSIGNHERELKPEDIAHMNTTGATVLENSWVEWKGVLIGGLSSAYFTASQKSKTGEIQCNLTLMQRVVYPQKDAQRFVPNVDWLENWSKTAGYKILLCHHPEYYPRYLKNLDIDLVLSGHAHGGQIRLFGQGLLAPGQGWFPKLTSGVHNGRLVISRGLANTGGMIPRLFNPEEIVYIQ